jgi:hypothetical protein
MLLSVYIIRKWSEDSRVGRVEWIAEGNGLNARLAEAKWEGPPTIDSDLRSLLYPTAPYIP